jgi:hypothetical protein
MHFTADLDSARLFCALIMRIAGYQELHRFHTSVADIRMKEKQSTRVRHFHTDASSYPQDALEKLTLSLHGKLPITTVSAFPDGELMRIHPFECILIEKNRKEGLVWLIFRLRRNVVYLGLFF